jgi:hypothetical protein
MRAVAQFMGFVSLLMVLLFVRPAPAEDVEVPVARQAELLVRVAAYDRSMAGRSAGRLRILIVNNPGDADSRSVAAQMDTALRNFDRIAGLPYDISVAPFASGAALAASCRASHIGIVYVAPGLDSSIGDIARSLDGVDVLSVAAIGRHARQGIALSFDLESGRPSILINLAQARKQNVNIAADVLSLMKVVP